jgi:hypothetical protein
VQALTSLKEKDHVTCYDSVSADIPVADVGYMQTGLRATEWQPYGTVQVVASHQL